MRAVLKKIQMKNLIRSLILVCCVLSSLEILHAQWTQTNGLNGGNYVGTIYSLAAGGTTLFAGTDRGVYRSTDDGAHWSLCNNGLTTIWVHSLAISEEKIFAGTVGGGIFLSIDNGTSWTAANSGLTNPNINDLTVVGTKIYASTMFSYAGVFLSRDGGSTWVNIGNTANGLTGNGVGTIVVSGDSLFAATDNGVFLSLNNGTSWNGMNNGLRASPVIFSLAFFGTRLFAGTGIQFSGGHGGTIQAPTGGYCSTDLGKTWNAVNIGSTSNEINTFVASGPNLFASSKEGVFRLNANGPDWEAINSGLEPILTNALAASPQYLFVALSNGTVWKRPMTNFPAAVLNEPGQIPASMMLGQNYPNPFNPSTTISFSLPTRSFVTLKIFDVMGREVASLVSEEMSAGNYSRQWNAAGMSSGMYFYRLQAGSFVQTKKLLLVR
jgi:photosystem II stability/assembly factor-like uncharacterized protein